MVWGAERPELLITETLAFHDRRTEDLKSPPGTKNGDDTLAGTDKTLTLDKPAASGQSQSLPINLDQRMRPKGSLFVEVYNPNSPDGQKPSELYRQATSADPTLNGQWGVDLQRLSDVGINSTGKPTTAKSTTASPVKYSPVWRLVVVEEDPNYRNIDAFDSKYDVNGINQVNSDMLHARQDAHIHRVTTTTGSYFSPINTSPEFQGFVGLPSSRIAVATKAYAGGVTHPFRPARMDWDGLFDLDFLPIATNATVNGHYAFEVAYPYIEREFYFTSNDSPRVTVEGESMVTVAQKDASKIPNDVSSPFLRIPNRSLRFTLGGKTVPPLPTPGIASPPAQTQRFIVPDPKVPGQDLQVAPILPGHYGVIGTAGPYGKAPTGVPSIYEAPELQDSYTTTIGRNLPAGGSGGAGGDSGSDGDWQPKLTRRIELRPSLDPSKPQVVINSNGGNPGIAAPPAGTIPNPDPASTIGRSNELYMDGGAIKSIATHTTSYYPGCVAIPVQGMNISEPPWGWGAREADLAGNPAETFTKYPDDVPPYKVTKEHPDGSYMAGPNPTHFNTPFDEFEPGTETVLSRTGTTANYRTVHLQRLANPNWPWNPPPLKADGKTANPEYNALLPVNPYRTVDTSTVDLTSFNGASNAEQELATHDKTKAQNEGKMRPFGPDLASGDFQTAMTTLASTSPAWSFKGQLFRSPKQVWYFKSHERGVWNQMNLSALATAPPQRLLWPQEPPFKQLLSSPTRIIGSPLRMTTMSAEKLPAEVKSALGIQQSGQQNNIDMVIEHSLGFGNESEGNLYAQAASTPPGAAGSTGAPYTYPNPKFNPATGATSTNPQPVTSTYPWLAWNNRPFVSAEELLQVPTASSEQLMSEYSTTDDTPPATGDPITNNPYDGVGVYSKSGTPTLVANHFRYKQLHARFGHLANMLSTADQAAKVPNGTNPAPPDDPADVLRNRAGVPILASPDPNVTNDLDKNVQAYGAPHFERILDYVQVPSRFVGTDELLNPDVFNNSRCQSGSPITRSRRSALLLAAAVQQSLARARPRPREHQHRPRPSHWQQIRRRFGPKSTTASCTACTTGNLYDSSNNLLQTRTRRPGFPRRRAEPPRIRAVQRGTPSMRLRRQASDAGTVPDTFAFGLNSNFPSFFSNPFRSADAGDLVPISTDDAVRRRCVATSSPSLCARARP